MEDWKSRERELTGRIVDAAIQVHSTLGPGLLESVYEQCLARELECRALRARRQVPIAVAYRDLSMDGGFRLDIQVEERVIVEVKAVEKLLPVHEAQILTYLKLSGLKVGLLLNFNVPLMKDGIRRFVRSS
jgi:GxxExxY protein